VIRRRWLRAICLLFVAALVASACGSDREEDESASTEDTTGSEEEAAPAGDATFGELESPCGEGDGGSASDQGVTEEAIKIGYGDDAGFANSPGLNHHQSDAIKAIVDWCNEQGGINGRQVDATYYDAKITEVNNAMLAACESEFMLVGQGWSLDSGQEETRLGCGLASVPAWSVSPAFAHGPMMIQPVPNPVDFTPTHAASVMADLFPEEIKKSATLVANYAATLDTRAKTLSAYPEYGFEFMDGCDIEYNISGESDWKPFAQKLKDCGAEFVYFAGSPFPNFENFLEAAAQLDFNPIYQVDVNFYDEQFGEWSANGLANNVYVRTAFSPLEDREEVPAVDDYLTMLEESGGDPAILGMQATSAFLLWATGVKACGAEVTRQCVLDEIGKIDEWTGGGLHAPTNPASNKPPECGALLKLEDGAFVRVQPKEKGEVECDPSYVAEVSGPVVDQAKLDADRVSTLFQQ
jgi:ABC-type branched-subunit amino acid transport system substrate-binding protein